MIDGTLLDQIRLDCKQDIPATQLAAIINKKYGLDWNLTNLRKILGFIRLTDHHKQIEGVTPEKSKPKIFVFDIETAPLEAYVWRLWRQNISHKNQLISDSWFMLTWAGKWLLEDEILSDKLTVKEVKKNNDKRIVKSLWDILDKSCLLYTSPSPRDATLSRMPSSA